MAEAIRKQKQFRSTMKDLLNDTSRFPPFMLILSITDNRSGRRVPAGTLTVVPFRRRRRLSRTPGQRDPARAVGGRIEERVDLAREGGGWCPVADDVGERGPPTAVPEAPGELPALRVVRPTAEDGEAEVRQRARRRHSPSGRGWGWWGHSRGGAAGRAGRPPARAASDRHAGEPGGP